MALQLSRRRFVELSGLGGLGLASGLALPSLASAAKDNPPPALPSPQQALTALIEGNKRWVSSRLRHPHQTAARRRQVAEAQTPIAVVFGCIDSRVPAEVVFDVGVGDIFVVRTAGQALDAVTLGSLVFGPEELSTPLIVVLGHERCGAVTAAVEHLSAGHAVEGPVGDVVRAIEPAYHAAQSQPGDAIDNTVRAQTRVTVDHLRAEPALQPRLAEGKLLIVGGRYDLDSGEVELIA